METQQNPDRWFEEETIRNSVFNSNLLVKSKDTPIGDDIHAQRFDGPFADATKEVKTAKVKLNTNKTLADGSVASAGGQITAMNYADENKEAIAIGTATRPLAVVITNDIDHTTHNDTSNVIIDSVKLDVKADETEFSNTVNVQGEMNINNKLTAILTIQPIRDISLHKIQVKP
jgi:hypothetical protein